MDWFMYNFFTNWRQHALFLFCKANKLLSFFNFLPLNLLAKKFDGVDQLLVILVDTTYGL